MEVVEAARWAPSAVNLQPWEFIVVTDQQVKAAVGRHARYMGVRWPHIHEAPALIAVCARRTTKFARDDCIFAAANLMLAATDCGLGTCWIGGFDERVIGGILGLPPDYVLPGFCTIGYSAGVTEPPPKRALEGLVHRDAFSGRPGVPYLRGPLEVLGRIVRLQLRRSRPG
jgi:nitroreductase